MDFQNLKNLMNEEEFRSLEFIENLIWMDEYGLHDLHNVYLEALYDYEISRNKNFRKDLNTFQITVIENDFKKAYSKLVQALDNFNDRVDQIRTESTNPNVLQKLEQLMQQAPKYPEPLSSDEEEEISSADEDITSSSEGDSKENGEVSSDYDFSDEISTIEDYFKIFLSLENSLEDHENEKLESARYYLKAKAKNNENDMKTYEELYNIYNQIVNNDKKILIDQAMKIKDFIRKIIKDVNSDLRKRLVKILDRINEVISLRPPPVEYLTSIQDTYPETPEKYLHPYDLPAKKQPTKPRERKPVNVDPEEALYATKSLITDRIFELIELKKQALDSTDENKIERLKGTINRMCFEIKAYINELERNAASDEDQKFVQNSSKILDEHMKELFSEPIKFSRRSGIPRTIQRPKTSASNSSEIPQSNSRLVTPRYSSIPQPRAILRTPGAKPSGLPMLRSRLKPPTQINKTSGLSKIPSISHIPQTTSRALLTSKNDFQVEIIVEQILKKKLVDLRTIVKQVPINEREKKEKVDVFRVIRGFIDHPKFFSDFEQTQQAVDKLKIMEKKLKKIFEGMRMVMSVYRGASFKFNQTDQAKINQFINDIVKQFSTTLNFNEYRKNLQIAFSPQKVPYPKFQIFQPHQLPGFVVTPASPRSNIARPSTTPGRTPQTRKISASTPIQIGKRKMVLPSRTASRTRPRALSRISSNNLTPLKSFDERMSSMGGITPTKTKVQQQVRDLSARSFKNSVMVPSIKQKLDKFLQNFCKIFIMNQKNRERGFKVWAETFHIHLNPILNDLDNFYKSLPFSEFKRFNRSSLITAFDKILKFVYEQTKDTDISTLKCKDMVGEEMKKLVACKHLEDLSKAMGVFVEGAKEILLPHLERVDRLRPTPRHISSRPRVSTVRRGRVSLAPSRSRVGGQKISTAPKETLQQEKIALNLTPSALSVAEQSYLERRQKKEAKLVGVSWRVLNNAKNLKHFKKVIGLPKELEDIFPDYKMNKALDVMLRHIIKIDELIFDVLSNRSYRPDRQTQLEFLLQDFRQQIISMIYNDDEGGFFSEIQEFNNEIDQLDVFELFQELGFRVYKEDEAIEMLEKPFEFRDRETRDITDYVLKFIKELRMIESKYLWKVLRNEYYGAPDYYYATDEYNKNPTDERIRISRPNYIDKVFNPSIPDDLIEKDILYVACLNTKSTDEVTKLEKIVIDIARQYQSMQINENIALKAISNVLDSINCIPHEFYEKFIYHKNNSNFDEMDREKTYLNEAARNDMLSKKKRVRCQDEDDPVKKAYIERLSINPELSTLLQDHNSSIDEYIKFIKFNQSHEEGEYIPMLGMERALNESGFLGIPEIVRSNAVTEGKLNDMRVGNLRDQEEVQKRIREENQKLLNDCSKILGDHYNEVDHFNNSRITGRVLIYELQPTALKRTNYWQPRGSEMPSWFPGIFAVFPDTLWTKPEKSFLPMKQLLTHAWRTMAPRVRGG